MECGLSGALAAFGRLKKQVVMVLNVVRWRRPTPPNSWNWLVADTSSRHLRRQTENLAREPLATSSVPPSAKPPPTGRSSQRPASVPSNAAIRPPVAEAQATARAYRTEAEVFPNMAHDMMLEPGWRKVAERIVAWLQEWDL